MTNKKKVSKKRKTTKKRTEETYSDLAERAKRDGIGSLTPRQIAALRRGQKEILGLKTQSGGADKPAPVLDENGEEFDLAKEIAKAKPAAFKTIIELMTQSKGIAQLQAAKLVFDLAKEIAPDEEEAIEIQWEVLDEDYRSPSDT